jgi:hypothetical protein
MTDAQYFSPSYQVARDRFRQAVTTAGWSLESHPLQVTAGDGSDLSIAKRSLWEIDVGCYGSGERAVVISSGLHGVEGYLGSAIQLAWLEVLQSVDLSGVRLVFLHALNPYGFSERRRWNEDGVDLNRNFLSETEAFAGSPEQYGALNAFFNPASPPSHWEPFLLKALWQAARYGSQGIKQTLAVGQYDYPQGLFFGGHGPTQTQQILRANLGRWLGDVATVTHVDFHTGLGATATYKLFPKETVDGECRTRLLQRFGAGSVEFPGDRRLSYPIRGGLGQWCQELCLGKTYDFVTAEFGTYPALKVFKALRAENRAHCHGLAGVDYGWTKELLVEMFAPASLVWRERCVAQGLQICQQAMVT